MNGIRILIALAAVALAAFVAAAPASSQALGAGSPLLGDNALGVTLPDLGGGSGGGSGGGGGGGGGGSAATGNVSAGDATADANVACIDADVLGITAKVGSCSAGGGAGGGGGGGNGGAADADADAGDVAADAGVGCVDIGLGDLGDGLQIGSCEAIMPPADSPDGGSGELPAETGGEGVAGAGADGAGGALGDAADCIAVEEASSTGTPYGIPPWLAGIVGVAMFALGAAVARRRRPHAEDVAV
jgi:hypothetical protein